MSSQELFHTGWENDALCVEIAYEYLTECQEIHISCIFVFHCDGSDICSEVGGQCGTSTVDNVTSLPTCWTCNTENLIVNDDTACRSPVPPSSATPSRGEKEKENAFPIKDVVGISVDALLLGILVGIVVVHIRGRDPKNESTDYPSDSKWKLAFSFSTRNAVQLAILQ